MCTHDRPLFCELWEFCSVFRPEVLSNFNNIQKSCIHTKFAQFVCLVVTALQFVLHIAAIEDLGWPGHHNPKLLLSWSHLARVRNSIAPSQRVSPFFRERIHTLHISPRLFRKDWGWFPRDNYAKNSLNRFQIGCIVYRQFSMSFAFELASGQWARSAENWTSAFCEFHQHPFSNIVPDSLWTVFTDTVPPLFRTRTNKWPLSFSKSPCVQRYEFGICQAFFFVVNWSTRNVIEHRHKYDSSCEKILWCLIWSQQVNVWLLHWAATYWILGKYSTRIRQSFCIPLYFWTIPIFVPMQCSIVGSRVSCQDTIQNLKKT